MLPQINTVYKFRFVPKFAALDGVYKTIQLIPYEEFLALDVDMVRYLYEKVGLTLEDYRIDNPAYANSVFIKLVHVDDVTNIIYVPSVVVLGVPQADIAKYQKLMLAIDLGTFADQLDFDTIITTLNEVLAKRVGVMVAPELINYGDEWLSATEYATLVATRATAKEAVVNYYSEAKQRAENEAILQARIVALQAIIISTQ